MVTHRTMMSECPAVPLCAVKPCSVNHLHQCGISKCFVMLRGKRYSKDFSRGAELGDFQRSCPTSITLQFCDGNFFADL